MKKQLTWKHTILSCYGGIISQAIVSCFAPLLFLTFQQEFAVSLEKLGLLVSVNFVTQLTVDALAAKYADKVGYRRMIVFAQICIAAGLILLSILPYALTNAYAGIVIATIIYAVGGGINEVLISPVVEAVPGDGKRAALSLLHSFYCWGSMAVVLLSTVLFKVFGVDSWRAVAWMWALLPIVNAVAFLKVPIAPLVAEGKSMKLRELMSLRVFWMFMLLMLCAGAAELSMAQWASAFAESGLKVSKAVGDLAGPCFFALMMGVGRVLQYRISDRIDMRKYMAGCAAVCVISYLIASLVPSAFVALLGFGLCGFAVSVMWPGTLDMAHEALPRGGTAMFAILALCGDVGCAAGPALVGFVSGALQDNLHMGILAAIIFPAVLTAGLMLRRRKA